MELGAHDAIAVFAGVRTLIVPHHRKGFLRDRTHGPHVLVELQVQHGSDVQAALRGMGIKGALCAVLLEDGGKPVGVVGEIGQRNGAVLDEGDRLAFLLHRHHHVEPGGTELRDGDLKRRFDDLHDAAPLPRGPIPAKAEIAHPFVKLLEAAQVLRLVLLGELDDQQRARVAAHDRFHGRPEHGDVAPERDHGAVHQFDRDGFQGDEVLRRIHGLVEAAEVADAKRLVADHRPELQLDLGREGQRPFRADEHMGHVVGRPIRHERVEVVAADAPLHLGKARLDLRRLALAERQQVAEEVAPRRVRVEAGQVAWDRSEIQKRAVGQRRPHRQRVVAHRAVAQRAPAAGVVAGHAADGGPRRRRDVDGKPQSMRLQLTIEVVQHDAGLDDAGLFLDIQRQDAVQVLGGVDD